MAIQGLRSTADFIVDGQRPKNWREGIMKLLPNGGATLAALTAMMKTRSVDDPEYNWYERELTDRRLALNANVANTSAQTTLTVVADALELKKGDMIRSEETGEIMHVAVDPTVDTTLVVDRGASGSTTAAITFAGAGVNPNLLVIGSAYEEGSLAPTGVQLDPVKKFNYTQIFRQTLEFTRTAIKTRLRTGDQVKQAKADALEMLSMDMERAFLLGKKFEGTYQGKPRRTSDGILARLTADAPANIIDAVAAGTEMEDFELYLKSAFQFGSNEKLALVGNGALLAINQIIRRNSHYNIQNGLKEYGMAVSRLTTPFGELILKRYTLFNNVTSGTTGGSPYYGMENWALILDADNLVYTHLKDSDIEFESKLQANGLDGEKSGYIGEASIEIHHAKSHFLIRRLVKGIPDA
jgi:hypothetical protein